MTSPATSPERSKTLTMVAEWSGRTGRSVNELIKMVEENIVLLQKVQPGRTPDFYERRARFMVYRTIKSETIYPGMVTLEGIFFGYGSKMDIFARRRQQAEDLYATNPQAAMDQGFTRPDGTPIYKYPSGGVVSIKEPIYLRQSVGLTRPARGGDLKLTILVHRLDQVDSVPPIGKPVRFAARLTEDSPVRNSYNTMRNTRFAETTMVEYPEPLDDGKICEMLLQAPADIRTTCGDLMEWHTKNANDARRICILEGDVVFLRTEPIVSTGSYMMVLEDETIMDFDAAGITVWIPGDIGHMLTFGTGSRVVTIGRSSAMPGYNRETRQVDRSVTRPGLNALAVFAIPEFRVPSEEEVLIETEEVT